MHTWQSFLAYPTRFSCIPGKVFLHTWQSFLAYLAKFSCIPGKVFLHTRQGFLAYLTRFSCIPGKVFLHTRQGFLAYLVRFSCIPIKVFLHTWQGYLMMRVSICSSQPFEPLHDKTNKMTCASSKDSDQPGHPPSLIRVFAVRMKKGWILSYPLSAQ